MDMTSRLRRSSDAPSPCMQLQVNMHAERAGVKTKAEVSHVLPVTRFGGSPNMTERCDFHVTAIHKVYWDPDTCDTTRRPQPCHAGWEGLPKMRHHPHTRPGSIQPSAVLARRDCGRDHEGPREQRRSSGREHEGTRPSTSLVDPMRTHRSHVVTVADDAWQQSRVQVVYCSVRCSAVARWVRLGTVAGWSCSCVVGSSAAGKLAHPLPYCSVSGLGAQAFPQVTGSPSNFTEWAASGIHACSGEQAANATARQRECGRSSRLHARQGVNAPGPPPCRRFFRVQIFRSGNNPGKHKLRRSTSTSMYSSFVDAPQP
nr:hypothetical protein CFP56_00954 [Quercus suber]